VPRYNSYGLPAPFRNTVEEIDVKALQRNYEIHLRAFGLGLFPGK
jgi:hypothetical protein